MFLLYKSSLGEHKIHLKKMFFCSNEQMLNRGQQSFTCIAPRILLQDSKYIQYQTLFSCFILNFEQVKVYITYSQSLNFLSESPTLGNRNRAIMWWLFTPMQSQTFKLSRNLLPSFITSYHPLPPQQYSHNRSAISQHSLSLPNITLFSGWKPHMWLFKVTFATRELILLSFSCSVPFKETSIKCSNKIWERWRLLRELWPSTH